MSRLVLLVDDEPDVRAVARLSLERVGGFRVVEADSGPAGVELAREHTPDAVLLDVMMPGTDGPATFALLQADPATAGIPVVLLTARVDQQHRDAWLAMGVTGVLGKPFDPMTLSSELAAVLGWTA